MEATKVAAPTAGPWEAIGAVVRDKRDANGNGGFLVADCLRGEAHEESHANAALIAAAPDLLAALEDIADRSERAALSTNSVHTRIATIARDAIAKAQP